MEKLVLIVLSFFAFNVSLFAGSFLSNPSALSEQQEFITEFSEDEKKDKKKNKKKNKKSNEDNKEQKTSCSSNSNGKKPCCAVKKK